MKTLFSTSIFHKTLAASALLYAFASAPLLAHESCDVSLTAGISINSQKIEFYEPNSENESEQSNQLNIPSKSLYKITADNQLVVNGETISLTKQQQHLITDYAQSIRTLVPKVKTLAIEGVDLALEGVDLAFTRLLGEGNDVGSQLNQDLLLIREAVDTKLSIEQGVSFGFNGNDHNEIVSELMGDDFEQRIENTIAKAVMNSMANLLVSLGQEMLFSGGANNDFEARMESFGDDIASEMEARTAKIEKKADQLCLSIKQIDQLEEQLKESIVQLKGFDVLTTKIHSNHNDEEVKNNKKAM